MSRFAAPVTLSGQHVTLVPLATTHHDALVQAVHDGDLWNHWYTHIPRPEAMAAEIQRRLELQATGSMCPFAVISPVTQQAVGMTTYMNIDATNRRVEIGSTWYRQSVQRTPMNTEAKHLLLAHALNNSTASQLSFVPIFSTRPVAAQSNAWVPSLTACCAATRSTSTPRPRAPCVTPVFTALPPANGPMSKRIWTTSSHV